MRRLAILVGAAVATVALTSSTSSGDPEPSTARSAPPPKCARQYTRAQFRVKASKTMRSPARLTRARGHRLHRMIRCAARPESKARMRAHLAKLRVKRRTVWRWSIRWGRVAPWLKARLLTISTCESHGNPGAIGGGGRYRGKYQMTFAIWGYLGGTGDPAAAPEREQDVRAARLYVVADPAGQWPVCALR